MTSIFKFSMKRVLRGVGHAESATPLHSLWATSRIEVGKREGSEELKFLVRRGETEKRGNVEWR